MSKNIANRNAFMNVTRWDGLNGFVPADGVNVVQMTTEPIERPNLPFKQHIFALDDVLCWGTPGHPRDGFFCFSEWEIDRLWGDFWRLTIEDEYKPFGRQVTDFARSEGLQIDPLGEWQFFADDHGTEMLQRPVAISLGFWSTVCWERINHDVEPDAQGYFPLWSWVWQ